MSAIIAGPDIEIDECDIDGCDMVLHYELDMAILLSEELQVRIWPVVFSLSQDLINNGTDVVILEVDFETTVEIEIGFQVNGAPYFTNWNAGQAIQV